MKFTLTQLKRYLKTEASANEIADKLNSIGFEVEEMQDKGKAYEPFIIAEIFEATPHPDAEKLRVCKVNNGKETLQIVCGAPNARAGIKVVLAPVGTLIPANGMQIKAAKIRGVESFGMLCSEEELGLKETMDGILELPTETLVGSKFADFANLNDIVFDIAITPNRKDAISVYGIARDLSAAGMGELVKLEFSSPTASSSQKVEVTIEAKDACYEFVATKVNNVKNSAEAEEISAELRVLGSSPKTALVDISNYAMLTLGRPNHIFDADKISGKITIRYANENEKFIALGGEEFTLSSEILVVADDSKVLAVAGVMGGELSKVDENTKNIIVEVAHFDRVAVAKSGRILKLNSDSRYRFERGIDSELTDLFVIYILSLIQKNCGGDFGSAHKVLGSEFQQVKEFSFDENVVEKHSGIKIASSEINRIITALGFTRNGNKVIVPSYRRGDVENQIDLVEEILRIYGFDKIPSTYMPIDSSKANKFEESAVSKMRRAMVSRNLNELITWSFVSAKTSTEFAFEDAIELANPITSELAIMRQSVLPNLLATASGNEAHGLGFNSYFEIGNIYNKKHSTLQELALTVARIGDNEPKNPFGTSRKYDFYDAKADFYAALEAYGFDPLKTNSVSGTPKYYHSGKSAAITIGKNVIGYVGELHPKIAAAYDISNAAVFELFIDRLPKIKAKAAKSKLEISPYQSVTRDFAFLMNKEVQAFDIIKEVKNIDPKITEEVRIFDIYEGDKIEAGKKSLAFSATLRSFEKTLSDAEINAYCDKVKAAIQSKFGAIQR